MSNGVIETDYVYDELVRMNFSRLSSRPLEKEEWTKIDELISRGIGVSAHDHIALVEYILLWRSWAPDANRDVLKHIVFTALFKAWQNLEIPSNHPAINAALDKAMTCTVTPQPDLVDKATIKKRNKKRGK